MVHQQRHMPRVKINQNETSKLISELTINIYMIVLIVYIHVRKNLTDVQDYTIMNLEDII